MYLPYRKLLYFSAFCNTCAASFSQVKVLRLTYAEVRAMSMGTGLSAAAKYRLFSDQSWASGPSLQAANRHIPTPSDE